MTNEKTPKEKLLAEWEKVRVKYKNNESRYYNFTYLSQLIDISDLDEKIVNFTDEEISDDNIFFKLAPNEPQQKAEEIMKLKKETSEKPREYWIADQIANTILARSLILQNRLYEGKDEKWENYTNRLSLELLKCPYMKFKGGKWKSTTANEWEFAKKNLKLYNKVIDGDPELTNRIEDLPWIKEKEKIRSLKSERELKKANEEYEELKKNYQDQEILIEAGKVEISKKNNRIYSLNGDIDNLKTEIANYQQQLTQRRGEICELEKKIKDLEEKIQRLETEKKTLEAKISEIREENKKEREKLINEKDNSLITKQEQYDRLELETNDKKKELENIISSKDREINELKNEQKQIRNDINKLFWFNSSTAREAVNKLIDQNRNLKQYEPSFLHHVGDYTGINWVVGKMGATFTVIGFGTVCSIVVPLIFKAWLAYQTAGISLTAAKREVKKEEPEPTDNNQTPLIQVIEKTPPVINEKAEPTKNQEAKEFQPKKENKPQPETEKEPQPDQENQ